MKRLKQVICTALSAALLLTIMSISALASGSKDFVVKDGVLTAYNGTDTVINIPSDLGITKISDFLFVSNKKISSVTIPEGVTTIGASAFAGCSNLTSVTLPKSLKSIVSVAFHDCSSLTSITIPDSVTSIGSDAFGGCSSLTSVVIPSGIEIIESSAFGSCAGLSSVTIPKGVKVIGDSAFGSCTGLTSVVIPDGVTYIGEGAFFQCARLTSITVPSTVTSCGVSAFGNGDTGVTIYGAAGSYIERYAKNYKTTFVASKDIPTHAIIAKPTISKVKIDGKAVSLQVYTIDGYNYFNPRDLAAALNGTDKHFNVESDEKAGTVKFKLRTPYTSVGGELTVSDNKADMTATPSAVEYYREGNVVYSNGETFYLPLSKTLLTAYTINGKDYCKLRELVSLADIGVKWDGNTNTILIDTTYSVYGPSTK